MECFSTGQPGSNVAIFQSKDEGIKWLWWHTLEHLCLKKTLIPVNKVLTSVPT